MKSLEAVASNSEPQRRAVPKIFVASLVRPAYRDLDLLSSIALAVVVKIAIHFAAHISLYECLCSDQSRANEYSGKVLHSALPTRPCCNRRVHRGCTISLPACSAIGGRLVVQDILVLLNVLTLLYEPAV